MILVNRFIDGLLNAVSAMVFFLFFLLIASCSSVSVGEKKECQDFVLSDTEIMGYAISFLRDRGVSLEKVNDYWIRKDYCEYVLIASEDLESLAPEYIFVLDEIGIKSVMHSRWMIYERSDL